MVFPATILPIEVSLALGADIAADPSTWSWTDVTTYTIVPNNGQVTIFRGRADEQSQTQPSWCTVMFNNADGRFSRLNPTGAYYGTLAKNTPLRVRVDPGTGYVTRFVGFVVDWPVRWAAGGAVYWTPIRATGVLRRLGQGQSPLKSALYRSIAGDSPAAHWPLEDSSTATQAASAISSVPPLSINGVVVGGASRVPAGAAGAWDLTGDGQLYGSTGISQGTSTGWEAELTVSYDVEPDNFAVLAGFFRPGAPGPVYLGYGISINISAGEAYFGLSYGDDTGWFGAFNANTPIVPETFYHLRLTQTQSGADIISRLYINGTLDVSNTRVGETLYAPTSTRLSMLFTPGGTQKDPPASVSGLAVFSSVRSSPTTYLAATGHAGEISGTRFARLCTEEGVQADVTAGSTEAMGPQTTKTLLDLLRECEAAEEGLIVERFTGKLGFDPHAARENQPVGLTLNYTSGHVVPPLDPADDDLRTRNDVTVTRIGGSSGRFVDEDGPVGVTAVGRYDEGVTLNLSTDDQTAQHASWRVNLGTVDGLRFPTVTVNLAKSTSLITSWLALDIGKRIQLTNLPNNVSYDDIDLIVEGYTEQISQKNWVITFNCAPYRPYQVGVLEDSMTLLTAEDTTSTTWKVACDPSFTTDSTDLPVALRVDGEVVSVTAVTPISISVVAGTAAHGDNASVAPVLPSHVEGDLVLIFAAIRNSGTGTVDTLTGYTSLRESGNVRVFGKYATSSAMADPTVSFTGGAAGDTTSAIAVRARGCQNTLLNSKAILNGSAQDIAFTQYVQEGDVQVLQFCWKQDDYTSVTSSELTEVAEASTITGNDQSLYVTRGAVSADSTPVPASSNVVTGGAAAISRVVFITLPRGVADLTVTRSINGVVTSHSQLATVQIDQPMVLAL